ncbi:MAG TPA: PKD domain-containing protein, partial [Candidatus Thermoplasmatota archaeon]|nr:PKD domain-containing protein [Candidatus Thermoplasmatota archaeon]
AAVAGETVRFDGSGSTDDRGIVAWAWDLDDDGEEDALGAVAEHAFAEPGTYVVRLTVSDAADHRHTAETAYVVSADPDAGLPEDRIPPVVRILHPTPGSRVASPVRVEWEVTDDGPLPSARLVVDRLARVVATAGAEDLDLASGAHVVAVEATDDAGNTGRESVAFLVDEPFPPVEERVAETRDTPMSLWVLALAAGIALVGRRRVP